MVIDISTLVLWTGLAVVIAWAWWVHRRLVRLKEACATALAGLEGPLRRQSEAVARLVARARDELDHERDILEAIEAAGTATLAAMAAALRDPSNNAGVLALGSAEATLRSLLGPLHAVIASYPVLRSDEAVRQLVDELDGASTGVGCARSAYNEAVFSFNGRAQKFPTLLLARMAGFGTASTLGEPEPHH